MKVVEIEAKSILVRSKLPDAEYVVNPYTGCVFGCHYCYASFAGRFVGEPIGNWGNYVYAKINAVPLFEVELARLRRAGRAPSILLSSVTDAYQGAEKNYRLTRGILEALAREPYPGIVGILTKSPLVLRDADLLGRHQVPKVTTQALVPQGGPHVFVPGHEPPLTTLVVEHRSTLAKPVQRGVRILQKLGIRGIEGLRHLYNYGLTIRLDRPSLGESGGGRQ